MWFSHFPRGGSYAVQGGLLAPWFQQTLAGLQASKAFHMAIPDSFSKHSSFIVPLCHSKTCKDTKLPHGKTHWGLQVLLLEQAGNTHHGARNPSLNAPSGGTYDRGTAWAHRWLSALVSQPSATYRPKRSGNHALCLPSRGWAQKNLHQDLGEPFARNVRNAHKKRQLPVGVDKRTIKKFEKARIQYFSLWANILDLLINKLVHLLCTKHWCREYHVIGPGLGTV